MGKKAREPTKWGVVGEDICIRCGAEFWGEHSCDPRLAEAIKERDEALARAEGLEMAALHADSSAYGLAWNDFALRCALIAYRAKYPVQP